MSFLLERAASMNASSSTYVVSWHGMSSGPYGSEEATFTAVCGIENSSSGRHLVERMTRPKSVKAERSGALRVQARTRY